MAVRPAEFPVVDNPASNTASGPQSVANLEESRNFPGAQYVILIKPQRVHLRWKDHRSGSSSERTITMRTRKEVLPLLAVLFPAFCLPVTTLAQTIPNGAAIDAEVSKIMTQTRAKGMAVAVIDHGKVGYVHAYGIRNAKGDPLTTDTVDRKSTRLNSSHRCISY